MVDAEAEVLTEVPDSLKRLVRYILRGFYGPEHLIVANMLMHHPCIKEDDLLDCLKFERKQLRAVVNSLKLDHFIKTRLRVETDAEDSPDSKQKSRNQKFSLPDSMGRTTKHNYFFICYSVFVNVVKYKLDHMRRKIETEERDLTNRASFVCSNDKCQKEFTDLEVGQLMDPSSGLLICTFCHDEVNDERGSRGGSGGAEGGADGSDGSAAVVHDPRTRMLRFNEQVEAIYKLLREVEDVKLSADILEPEPCDFKSSKSGWAARGTGDPGNKWSGDATRHGGINYADNQITISTSETDHISTVKRKEAPVWMSHSTVDGSATDRSANKAAERQLAQTKSDAGSSRQNTDDIMRTLLSHEKRPSSSSVVSTRDDAMRYTSSSAASAWGAAGVGGIPDASSSDESEDSNAPSQHKPMSAPTGDVAEMGSNDEDDDDEDGVVMVTVAGTQYPYHEVTNDMVALMSPAEKQEYIRLGQEMYEQMYE